jgi:hypothetical protein
MRCSAAPVAMGLGLPFLPLIEVAEEQDPHVTCPHGR